MRHSIKRLGVLGVRLVRDECGALASMEMVLISTIVTLGMIVGLTTWRDAVVQELGDSAAAVAELNQGYRFNQIRINKVFATDDGGSVRVTARVEGSRYIDRRDFCQARNTDPRGAPPMCISITAGPSNEL